MDQSVPVVVAISHTHRNSQTRRNHNSNNISNQSFLEVLRKRGGGVDKKGSTTSYEMTDLQMNDLTTI
jgi:hypothetical protein